MQITFGKVLKRFVHMRKLKFFLQFHFYLWKEKGLFMTSGFFCFYMDRFSRVQYSIFDIAMIGYGPSAKHCADKANAQARKHNEQSEFHFGFGFK